MADFIVTKIFSADIAECPGVVDFAAEQAEQTGLDPKRLMHLQLAVEEAFVNICHYAYGQSGGQITVETRHTGGRFEVDLIDEGGAFDPLAREDPDVHAELQDRTPGGLGIFLMRRIMDELHYRREGNRNILTLVLYSA